MPKYTLTSDGGYKYKCTCGTEMVYYHDKKEVPDRLVKCFQCIKKEAERKKLKKEVAHEKAT